MKRTLTTMVIALFLAVSGFSVEFNVRDASEVKANNTEKVQTMSDVSSVVAEKIEAQKQKEYREKFYEATQKSQARDAAVERRAEQQEKVSEVSQAERLSSTRDRLEKQEDIRRKKKHTSQAERIAVGQTTHKDRKASSGIDESGSSRRGLTSASQVGGGSNGKQASVTQAASLSGQSSSEVSEDSMQVSLAAKGDEGVVTTKERRRSSTNRKSSTSQAQKFGGKRRNSTASARAITGSTGDK
jgi:hypothetical protein